jgi:hypothetical protein
MVPGPSKKYSPGAAPFFSYGPVNVNVVLMVDAKGFQSCSTNRGLAGTDVTIGFLCDEDAPSTPINHRRDGRACGW